MNLYQKTLPQGGRLTGWCHDVSESMPEAEVRPAVLILPGGGYAYCADREKDPAAARFFAAGYQVFLLEYSTDDPPLGWRPLIQAAEAICHMRSNAVRLCLDPRRIAVCGFSAGGHLAASTALLHDARPVRAALGLTGDEGCPNAVVLCYPVITSGEYAHEGSFDRLAGTDPALREVFSLENQVRPGLPPFFIWHTVTDADVPVQNSLLLVNALEANDVPYELHLFGSGRHGMSVCTEEVGCSNRHNAAWLPLCVEWLSDQFDFHLGE